MIRRLLKFIAATAIVLAICVFIGAITIIIHRFSAKQQITQQLDTLDQQFSTARNPIPLTVDIEMLLPKHVGSFQRHDIFQFEDGRCFDWHFEDIKLCLSAYYKSSPIKDRFGRDAMVWFGVWERSAPITQGLQAMIGTHLCGAELGGEIILRVESKIPYAYHVCTDLTSAPSLYGVVWQNGNWFITVEGNYDSFSPFIAAYLY